MVFYKKGFFFDFMTYGQFSLLRLYIKLSRILDFNQAFFRVFGHHFAKKVIQLMIRNWQYSFVCNQVKSFIIKIPEFLDLQPNFPLEFRHINDFVFLNEKDRRENESLSVEAEMTVLRPGFSVCMLVQDTYTMYYVLYFRKSYLKS